MLYRLYFFCQCSLLLLHKERDLIAEQGLLVEHDLTVVRELRVVRVGQLRRDLLQQDLRAELVVMTMMMTMTMTTIIMASEAG